jgi:hypothetical protein
MNNTFIRSAAVSGIAKASHTLTPAKIDRVTRPGLPEFGFDSWIIVM